MLTSGLPAPSISLTFAKNNSYSVPFHLLPPDHPSVRKSVTAGLNFRNKLFGDYFHECGFFDGHYRTACNIAAIYSAVHKASLRLKTLTRTLGS
jgi:hypothetical protein